MPNYYTMNKFLTAICLVLPVLVFSQNDLPAKPKKVKKQKPAPQWDTLYFKNELSLDISPAVAFVTGNIADRESFGFTYRRFLGKRDAIRVGTRHSVSGYSYTGGGIYRGNFLPDSIRTFNIGDTLAYNRFYQWRNYSPDIRIGYEHRFGKRRFKCMLGIDALLGIERIKLIDETDYYTVHTATDSIGTFYYLQATESNAGFPYNEKIGTYLKVGASPFVGVQVHLSKRFSLNASFLVDVAWNIPLKGDDLFQGLNLNAYAPAADIGLTVHF